MRKWIVGTLSALLVAGLLLVPAGCGSNQATKIDSEGYEQQQPPGHEQATKDMEKATVSGK